MPSNYAAFEVKIDNDDGSITPVPGQIIKVYDVTHAAALSDLASDGDGHVAGGTLPVVVGTVVRFSFSQVDGHCGYAEVVTT
jgi:hypothetical protein